MKLKLKKATKYRDTVAYVRKALQEIRSNPNHGYSEKEVERIQSMTKPIPIPKNLIETSNLFLKGMDAIYHIFKTIGDEAFGSLKYASERGWYISPNIVHDYSMAEIYEHMSEDKFEIFEKKIIKAAVKLVPNILKECIREYPHRKAILNELSKLYSAKNYYAVVALAYTQADGISNENWNCGFFDRENYNKKQKDKPRGLKVIKAVDASSTSMSSIISKQLGIEHNEITQSSFSSKFKNTASKIKSYNRHYVIHGHSTGYGTKENAIRSIYLLDFIVYLHKNHTQDKDKNAS